MKELELLNKIAKMTVCEFIKFINEYEFTLEEYKSNFSDLEDDGIYDTPVVKLLSFVELCRIVDILKDRKKSEIPSVYKFKIEKMNKSIITIDKFKEIYKKDKALADDVLRAAIFVQDTLNAYRKMFNL